MGDSTSRLFGVLGLAIAVWVVVFWLYEPSSRRRILVDERPIQEAAPPAPALPQPRSLPPAANQPQAPGNTAGPEPDPVRIPPPEPMPVAGPGEVLIPPEFIDYTVQTGDRSLQDIAVRFYGDRSRWTAISRANPFFTPDKLKPGVTILRIPKDPDNIRGKVVKIDPPQSSPPAAPATAQQPDRSPADPPKPSTVADGWRTYVVQDNDTLWGIAKRMYGRPSLTNLIAEANTDVLPDPDRIKAGITLRIPPAPPAD
jgi:nucleoid-associated protein YgaU